MAGSYPDVPGRRMAWDADGTVALMDIISGGQTQPSPVGPWTEIDSVDKVDANDESTAAVTGSSIATHWFAFIFPELRELDGWLGAYNDKDRNDPLLETSPDTTNGIDGTWTSRSSSSDLWQQNVDPISVYRDEILSFAVNSIRGVRARLRTTGSPPGNLSVRAMHIYGTISPGETPDRLLFIDEETGLEFTGPIDYGDVPRGSARDVELRIKNNSTTLTATTIQYTVEALTGSSGSYYTMTTPGGSSFSSTQQISSLGAEATSGLIKLRQILPDDATLGLHSSRLYTDVTSWG